jgi:hypothetical protein
MDELQLLKQENEEMKNKIIELEERLKKYTAPQRSKSYYENHKEEIQLKTKDRTIPPDKKKEYNKNYYLRKKEKIKEHII